MNKQIRTSALCGAELHSATAMLVGKDVGVEGYFMQPMTSAPLSDEQIAKQLESVVRLCQGTRHKGVKGVESKPGTLAWDGIEDPSRLI